MKNVIELNVNQGEQEWFEARVGCMTASRVAAALGISPFTSRKALMQEMLREYDGLFSDFSTEAMRWGTDNEPRAIEEYLIIHNHADVNDVKRVGIYLKADEPWKAASPDLVLGEGLLEVKCPFRLREELEPVFLSIEDLPHYMAQIQWQMHVTEAEWVDFYQWTPHGDMCERVHADPSWWADHGEQICSFMDEYEDLCNGPAEEREAYCAKGEKRQGLELPTLMAVISGSVERTNIIEYRDDIKQMIAAINTDLNTDNDFAEAEHVSKELKKAEGAIEQAKKQWLAQTASIDELLRETDAVKELCRQTRLKLEKLVKSRKEEIKRDLISNNREVLQGAWKQECTRLDVQLPLPESNFGEAIKGKRNLDSMVDAVNAHLGAVLSLLKDEVRRVEINMTAMEPFITANAELYPDWRQLVLREKDALVTECENRKLKHEARKIVQERAPEEVEDDLEKAEAPAHAFVGDNITTIEVERPDAKAVYRGSRKVGTLTYKHCLVISFDSDEAIDQALENGFVQFEVEL